MENSLAKLNYIIFKNYIPSNIKIYRKKLGIYFLDYNYHHFFTREITEGTPILIIIQITKHKNYTKKIKNILKNFNIKWQHIPYDINIINKILYDIDNYILVNKQPYAILLRKSNNYTIS